MKIILFQRENMDIALILKIGKGLKGTVLEITSKIKKLKRYHQQNQLKYNSFINVKNIKYYKSIYVKSWILECSPKNKNIYEIPV